MLKIAKVSTTILVFYILFYLQTWGDNHLILYASALTTVFSIAIYCFFENRMDINNVPYGVWNNLFMVVYSLVFGIFVAFDYSRIITSSVTLAAYAVVCIAICYVSYVENSFEWVLNIFIVLAVVCAAYAFFFGSVWKGYGKTLSLSNNPHFFAAVMNLGTFSIAYRIKDANKKLSIIWTILLGVLLYSIVQCGSRKYLIATALILIVWIYTSLRERWKKGDSQERIKTIIALFLIIILVYYYYSRYYISSESYSRMMDNDDMGNQNRIVFYRKAFDIFLTHPIFGGGYDQFRYWAGTGGYAHSTYAEAIADFGFVGCLLYFTPIFYTTYQIAKTSLYNRDYKSSLLLAFCIAELFIGAGQIFFMEFHHFIAWTILFYYSHEARTKRARDSANNKKVYKYIR